MKIILILFCIVFPTFGHDYKESRTIHRTKRVAVKHIDVNTSANPLESNNSDIFQENRIGNNGQYEINLNNHSNPAEILKFELTTPDSRLTEDTQLPKFNLSSALIEETIMGGNLVANKTDTAKVKEEYVQKNSGDKLISELLTLENLLPKDSSISLLENLTDSKVNLSRTKSNLDDRTNERIAKWEKRPNGFVTLRGYYHTLKKPADEGSAFKNTLSPENQSLKNFQAHNTRESNIIDNNKKIKSKSFIDSRGLMINQQYDISSAVPSTPERNPEISFCHYHSNISELHDRNEVGPSLTSLFRFPFEMFSDSIIRNADEGVSNVLPSQKSYHTFFHNRKKNWSEKGRINRRPISMRRFVPNSAEIADAIIISTNLDHFDFDKPYPYNIWNEDLATVDLSPQFSFLPSIHGFAKVFASILPQQRPVHSQSPMQSQFCPLHAYHRHRHLKPTTSNAINLLPTGLLNGFAAVRCSCQLADSDKQEDQAEAKIRFRNKQPNAKFANDVPNNYNITYPNENKSKIEILRT